MAAHAVKDALGARARWAGDVDFLAAATTQGDLACPASPAWCTASWASRHCEIAQPARRLRQRHDGAEERLLQVAAGEKRNAVACASELPSRLFKASRYEAQVPAASEALPFDAEFLRWMLSDGAGAAVLQPRRARAGSRCRSTGSTSAPTRTQHATCMYAGAHKGRTARWARAGSTTRPSRRRRGGRARTSSRTSAMLDALVQLGVDGFFELIERGPHRGRRARLGRLPLLVPVLPHAHLRAARRRAGATMPRGALVLQPDHAWATPAAPPSS